MEKHFKEQAFLIDLAHEGLHELARADNKHGCMLEEVEGLHTLKCEVQELEREIMRKNRDKKAMRNEALQVMAMSFKFLRDCCEEEGEKYE